ncbi:MAG: DUF3500 domain-containing protein [Ilumatobacteraceae bacterium]
MMTAQSMSDIATEFLASLTDDQRVLATFDFENVEERIRWFYTPTDHGGLPLAKMAARQHRLVYRLLASALSEGGYTTVTTIIGLENVLDRLEGFVAGFERERGRDPLQYWISIFGEPSDSGSWSWRFGGHHVSLHFTVRDGEVQSSTPCFLGADPANSLLLGPHLLRPLAAVEDLAREFIHGLSMDQRAIAIVGSVPPTDIVGANRSVLLEGDTALPLPLVWRKRFDGALDDAIVAIQDRADRELGITEDDLARVSFTRNPKGLSVASMTASQRDELRALLKTYIDRIADDLADSEWRKINGSEFEKLTFLWAGGIESGEPHYYRVQGGRLFVEYDNTQRGTNHIHTVWRDLENDFAGDALALHYSRDH